MNKSDTEEARVLLEELIAIGRFFHGRGWTPATSGNFSARTENGTVYVTVSGKHKGELTPADFLPLDESGRPLGGGKTSAETPLHLMLYDLYPETRSVLHTHSAQATVLSRSLGGRPLEVEGYEVQKAFSGIDTHETSLSLPVFPNDQDVERLARVVKKELKEYQPCYGFLIEGHGLYAWGSSTAEARRHLEAFEFLFECEILKRGAGLI